VTLYCNNDEFSELEYGDQLFGVVARQILDQRQEAQRYRCYITDLDLSGLSGDAGSQTILYLRYKTELERSLNDAMTGRRHSVL
jgi:adenylate cyclase class 1